MRTTDAFIDDGGNLLKADISGLVTIVVIIGLEIINVQKKYGQLRSISNTHLPFRIQEGVAMTPVGQPRQYIAGR